MRGAWICVFLAVLTACGTQKVVTDIQRDSVAVIVRDSVIFRDSVVLVEVPKEGDKAVLPDSDTSHLETTIAESVAWVADGRLHHTLRNKDAAIIPVTIKMPERLHYEGRDRLIYNRIVETIEVEKELSRWQRFLQTIGWVVIIGLAGYIITRVVRLFS
jgi:hypothetical protein